MVADWQRPPLKSKEETPGLLCSFRVSCLGIFPLMNIGLCLGGGYPSGARGVFSGEVSVEASSSALFIGSHSREKQYLRAGCVGGTPVSFCFGFWV